MRLLGLFTLLAFFSLGFGAKSQAEFEKESKEIQLRTEKTVNEALNALSKHHSLLSENESKFYKNILEEYAGKDKSSSNEIIRTSNKYLLIASTVLRKLYFLQMVQNMRQNGPILSEAEAKDLETRIKQANTAHQLRKAGLDVLKLAPQGIESMNGADSLRKHVDDAIDSWEKYWKMMEPYAKSFEVPFKEKHDIEPVKEEPVYDPRENQRRRARALNDNEGLSLYGKHTRFDPNENLRPYRYPRDKRYPGQSADHATDPYRPHNPYYPHLTDQEYEARKKQLQEEQAAKKPLGKGTSNKLTQPNNSAGHKNSFADLMKAIDHKFHEMPLRHQNKVEPIKEKFDFIIELLLGKIDKQLTPEEAEALRRKLFDILKDLNDSFGKRNPKKAYLHSLNRVRKEIAKSLLAKDADLQFFLRKKPKRPQEIKHQPPKEQPAKGVYPQPPKVEQKPTSPNIAIPPPKQLQEQPKVDLENLNQKVIALVDRVDHALDKQKKIDDEIKRKQNELEALKRQIEAAKEEEKKLKEEQEKKENEEREKKLKAEQEKKANEEPEPLKQVTNLQAQAAPPEKPDVEEKKKAEKEDEKPKESQKDDEASEDTEKPKESGKEKPKESEKADESQKPEEKPNDASKSKDTQKPDEKSNESQKSDDKSKEPQKPEPESKSSQSPAKDDDVAAESEDEESLIDQEDLFPSCGDECECLLKPEGEPKNNEKFPDETLD